MRQLRKLLFFLTIIVIGNSCNLFDEGISPVDSNFSTLSPNRYEVPNQPFIIDLRNYLHAKGGLNFRIERQASHGNLDFLEEAFLKYEPHEGFEGRDFFIVGIYAGNSLQDVDSTVEEIGEGKSQGFRYTYHDYYEVPMNGSVIVDSYPNSRQCLDSISSFGWRYNGRGNGSFLSYATNAYSLDYIYQPAPGFAGMDWIEQEISLMDRQGNTYEAQLLTAIEVTGSEAFLSEDCAEVWPNQFEVLEQEASDLYVVQVKYPKDNCALDHETLSVEFISSGEVVYEEGKIRYFNKDDQDYFPVIQYMITFSSGDVLRRRLQLQIISEE